MNSGKIDIVVPFITPVRMPNGLQWDQDELFVMDQLTDDVFVLDDAGSVLRVVNTETETWDWVEPKINQSTEVISYIKNTYQPKRS